MRRWFGASRTAEAGGAATPESQATLSEVRGGASATVCSLCPTLDAGTASRLADLGFHEGAVIEHVRTAPLGDPVVYRVCDVEICLRRAQASRILVTDHRSA